MNRTLLLILIGFCISNFSYGQSIEKSELQSIIKIENDSVKNARLHDFIYHTYIKKDWELFNQSRLIHLNFARQRKDSSSYASTLEFSGSYFQNYVERPDSAFYYYTKSKLIYQALGDSIGIGRVLLNNAIIRKNIHDYAGSISTSYETLEYIDKNEAKNIASVYNNLGITYNQLKDSIDAIKYHLKSLALRNELTEYPNLRLQSLNNLGRVYKGISNYKKALEYLLPIIEDSIVAKKYPKTYAMALDNYGHALFLNTQVEKGFDAMQKALIIRSDISHKDGIVINKIHLAEYYLQQKDTTKAIAFAESANSLAKEILNYRDYLVSMKFLANLYKGEKSKNLYKTHDRIKDSLSFADRKYRDQFGQFEFELDEKQNELLSKEKELIKNQYIFISIGIITLLIIFFYTVRFFKSHRLKKQFEKGFRSYLIDKYNLTPENIDFWQAWLLDLKPEKLAEQLFISIDAVKSRRKSLRDKIYKVYKIKGDFTQSRAIRIYNEELEKFKKHG